MDETPEEIISRFEATCIKALVAKGYGEGDARSILNAWIERTAKRQQALRLEMKMMQIR